MTRRLHRFTAMFLALFIALHLMNHLCGVFGVEVHIQLMKGLRNIYRNFVVECLLIFALLVQMITGICQLINYRHARSTWGRIQKLSGLYLLFFILIHTSAVMVARYFLKLDTNFYFAAAGINQWPYRLFFLPYYGFAVVSLFAHVAAIHFKKMNRHILGCSVPTQSLIIASTGVLIAVLIILIFTNAFKGFVVPSEYLIKSPW